RRLQPAGRSLGGPLRARCDCAPTSAPAVPRRRDSHRKAAACLGFRAHAARAALFDGAPRAPLSHTKSRLESVIVTRISFEARFAIGVDARRKGIETLTTALRSEDVLRHSPRLATARRDLAAADALRVVLKSLDEAKAEDPVSIDITGKSPIGDCMSV